MRGAELDLASRYGRLAKAVGSGSAARLLTAGVSLLSLPLAVRYLGGERFGVWATVSTTVVWINLLDLGIANTLTNHISRAYAQDDKLAAARSFSNALALTAGVAGMVGLVFAIVSRQISWARLFNVSASIPGDEIRRTVAVAACLTLLGLPCSLGSKLLAGYQELHRYNYVVCAGAVSSLIGLAAGIGLRVSMPVLLLMSAGCMTFAGLAMLVAIVWWQKPWLRPRLALLDRSVAGELLRSGYSFFLIQVAAVVVFSSDNLIVSHYLGAAEVTPYNVTWRLVGLAAVLQSLMFPALWPAYAEAYARNDYAWIRRTFAITMKGTMALNGCCVAVLLVCGRGLIRWWAGGAAVPGMSLLLAMGLWAMVNGFMSVESCLLAALNRTREQGWLSVLAAAVNIALSIFLVHRIGSLGVIAGTILSYLLVLVVPQTVIVREVWMELGADERSTAASRVIANAAKWIPARNR